MTDFPKALALTCARASAAAYELDDGKRAALLAEAALQEIGFIQAREDARLLVAETLAGGVLWAFQGTQFDRGEVPSIIANLETSPRDLGQGRSVMEGYARQLDALMPFLAQPPTPSIVTGHSMGGVLASLCANTCAALMPAVPPQLVTFGAPRFGNVAFWQTARLLPLRVEHESDPAPRWPLDGPYVQPGQCWWLHGGTVTLCDHWPDLADMVADWGDHMIAGYVAVIEALD